jgi:hypothetical protein
VRIGSISIFIRFSCGDWLLKRDCFGIVFFGLQRGRPKVFGLRDTQPSFYQPSLTSCLLLSSSLSY